MMSESKKKSACGAATPTAEKENILVDSIPEKKKKIKLMTIKNF